jgi:adenylosuccinate synthase
MPTLVIVGSQWGDEAKGKLVDVIGSQADFVVRYSGGNNAGHTVIVGDREFKFHLLPAGILHPEVRAILGGGMVICPKSLLEELESTRAKAPNLGELLISASAHVVFPYHRLLDQFEEEARGHNKIGTTSRGIGPAYQDKVGRFGIRMGELVEPATFSERLREVLAYKNRLIEMFGGTPLDFEELRAEYGGYAETIRPFVSDTDVLVQDAVELGKRVLFEGAQGTFLDLDSGTYPYVTSSHPTSGGACLGTGIGPRAIDRVLGVCKAYTTRVGSGPFPTELTDEIGEWIRQHGKEFGTTTGRGRRCGWLDLVLLRQSARLNSLSGLVVTRLDVLSGFEKVKVATAYELYGSTIRHVPQNTFDFARVGVEYTEMEGWSDGLRSARRLDDLPGSARSYLEFMEEFTGVPIALVSVGPDRAETIVVRPELVWG